MNMRCSLLVVCALGASARADVPPRPITLAEALSAVSTAPAASIYQHEVSSAAASVDAAGAWTSPTLHVATNRLTAKLAAGFVFPLPIFGTVGALRNEAAAHARTVVGEATVQRRDLARRAVLAWIALARADANIVVRTTAAKQAAELEQIARGRLDAGVGAEVDVTTASAARARADIAVSTARREQQAAAAELAAVLGWDPMRRCSRVEATCPARSSDARDAARATRGAPRAHGSHSRGSMRAPRPPRVSTRRVTRIVAVEFQVSIDDPTTPGTDVFGGLAVELPVFARVGDQLRAARATTAAERARLATTEADLDGSLVAAYRRWQATRRDARRARARRRAGAGARGQPRRAGVPRGRARSRDGAPGRSRPRGGARRARRARAATSRPRGSSSWSPPERSSGMCA